MSKTHHNRSSRPAAGTWNLHLIDPLPPNPLLDSPEMDEALVMEAQRRGANEFDLLRLLKQRRQAQQARSSVRVSFGLVNDREALSTPSFFDEGDLFRVQAYREQYLRTLREEWQNLPKDVQDSFAFDKRVPFDHYCRMRPVFYCAGYSNPAETIFQRIKPAKLLGHPVGGGLHEAFIEKLADLEPLLERWAPGLAKRVSSGIRSKSVGGFVPRFIAPKQGQKHKAPSLSNHAFGLAIDVDSVWNPHIKDREVFEVLKGITGYDFGQDIVEKDKSIPEIDRVAQIHLLIHQASDRLRAWLRRYLPIYESTESQKPHRSKEKIPVLPEPGGPQTCEELDAETAAQMASIQVLRKHHSLHDLQQWMAHGIETIPLELAAGLAKLGFRWGATYEHSKDVMHFELLAADVLEPDAKKRPLDELFTSPAHVARSLSVGAKRT